MTAPEKQNSPGYRATKDSSKWYVLITKPRAEKQVSKRFTEMGICHFLPMQKQLRQWHDRRNWVEIPLFNHYIFVKTQNHLRSKVFEAGGLIKYLFIGGEIGTLTEEEVHRIRLLCSSSKPVTVQEGVNLGAGDEVEILEGHFAGMRGILLQDGDNQKLKLSIGGLGCFATVAIDKTTVKKISA